MLCRRPHVPARRCLSRWRRVRAASAATDCTLQNAGQGLHDGTPVGTDPAVVTVTIIIASLRHPGSQLNLEITAGHAPRRRKLVAARSISETRVKNITNAHANKRLCWNECVHFLVALSNVEICDRGVSMCFYILGLDSRLACAAFIAFVVVFSRFV